MGELKGRTSARRRSGPSPVPREETGAGSTTTGMMDLQRTAGNRATSGLVDPKSTHHHGGERRRRRRKRGRRGGQAPNPSPSPSPSTSTPPIENPSTSTPDQETTDALTTDASETPGWGSWLGGLITSGLAFVHPASAEEGDDLELGQKDIGTFGEFGEEHDEPLGAESLLDVPEISVTIDKGKLKREIGDAELSGEYELKALLHGYEGSAQIEVTRGKERTSSLGNIGLFGGALVGEFSTTEFLGDRIGAKGKGTLSPEKAAVRAEASAFSGYEHKGNTTVRVNVGNQEIASFEGSAGYTVGYGGEVKGHVSFAGGKVSIGSKGAVSVGVGTVWEYKLEIDTPAMATGLWNVASSWARWLSDVATDLDDALTDEDGEPIRIF